MVAQGARLDSLTGLRFIAAFAIVVHHARDTFIPTKTIEGLPLDSGVSLFFVLSGFILTYVYPELPTGRAVMRFYAARLGRIWPVHIVALLLLLVLLPGARDTGVLPTLANIFLVQAWIPLSEFFFSYNAVSWSVSTELGFYVLFPLLIWGLRWNWQLKLAGAAALVVGAISLCHLLKLPNYDGVYKGVTNFGILYFNPLVRLFEFMLGMCCSLLWTHLNRRFVYNAVAWTVAELAAVAAILWYLFYGRGVILNFAMNDSGAPVSIEYLMHTDFAPLYAVLIFVLARGEGLLGRILAAKPFVFLGEISYSVYMVHQILINSYANHLPLFAWVPTPLKFPLFVIVMLLLCSAIFLGIESPARTFVASLFTRSGRAKIAVMQPAGEEAR